MPWLKKNPDLTNDPTYLEPRITSNENKIGIFSKLKDDDWSDKESIIDVLIEQFARVADLGTNVKKYPFNAIGDGLSHPLSERFGTLEGAQLFFPTATSLTEEIDYHAIRRALDITGNAYVPDGEFVTHKRLNVQNARLIGLSRRLTTINCWTSAEAIVGVSGLVTITDITFRHKSLPTAETIPNGSGIHIIGGVNDGSVFARLRIWNVTSGFLREDANTFYVYSTSFRDIRFERFTHSGLYIGGSGHTGSIFSNLYAVNWDNYELRTKLEAEYGFYIQGCDEGVAHQLNVEHGIYKKGIVINGVGNFDLSSVHFEGYEAKSSYASFIHVLGTDSLVNIKGVSIVFSKVDAAKTADYSLLSIGNTAKVIWKGFKCRDNTLVGSPQLRKFYGDGSIQEGASIKVDNFVIKDSFFQSSNFFTNTTETPVLKQYNDEVYYSKPGGKKLIYRTTLPTSGTWNVGDRVVNTSPTIAKNIQHWVCLASGTYGGTAPVWTAFGTGQGTTAQRPSLIYDDRGYLYYDTDVPKLMYWNGSAWV